MCLFKKKKIKYKYPETAKYKLNDFINFIHNKELYFGYICGAKVVDGKIIYTIQTEGECPSMIFNYKEEDIL